MKRRFMGRLRWFLCRIGWHGKQRVVGGDLKGSIIVQCERCGHLWTRYMVWR